MSETSSCLVTKLSHYVPLSDLDRERLAKLEKAERAFAARQEIYQGGDENRNLYVVKGVVAELSR